MTARDRGGPAGAAGAAVAVQQPGVAAGTAGRAGSAGSRGPAVAEQARGPAIAAALARPARRAGTAVAEQQPTRAAGLPRQRPVGAGTDQRAPQQCLGGRVHQVQRLLLHRLQRRRVGGLGTGIRGRAGGQGAHELVVKGLQPGADGLKLQPVRTEHLGNRRRHLVGGRGQHPGRRCHRCRVGGAER